MSIRLFFDLCSSTKLHLVQRRHTSHRGYLGFNGICYDIGNYGHWWSSTERSAYIAWCRFLIYSSGNSYRGYDDVQKGLSVRCVKD
ncbi:MAG: hypothetical protein KJS45_10590 [Bacteroidetes bacterium]|nr:hypothetical protein [Bacteroidota bacterium]